MYTPIPFHQATAVNSGTAITLPTWAPPLVAIKSVSVVPGAHLGTASTTSPFDETPVLGTPSAGQVELSANNQITCGDNVPADSDILVIGVAMGEAPNPASN